MICEGYWVGMKETTQRKLSYYLDIGVYLRYPGEFCPPPPTPTHPPPPKKKKKKKKKNLYSRNSQQVYTHIWNGVMSFGTGTINAWRNDEGVIT